LGLQDWLLPKPGKAIKKCPPGAGWGSPTYYGACTKFSPAVPIPYERITNLREFMLAGAASPRALSIYLSVGSNVYGMADIESDATDLASNWKGAEFNIFGSCCAYRAVLNRGSTIRVRLETVTRDKAAPTCVKGIGTGETNNLSFIRAPSSPTKLLYPSILFTESNASGGGTASCDAVPGFPPF
jgi:hypothetical protein